MMRRETSRNGAVLLMLLLGACAVGAYWLTDAASRVGRAAAARSLETSTPALPAETLVDASIESSASFNDHVDEEDQRPGQASNRASLQEDEQPALIEGTVIDRAGHAILHATVQLRDSAGEKQSMPVSADGRFRFETGPGDYSLIVAPMPLESGWLAPWGQEREARPLDHPELTPGFFARKVQVQEEAERHEVTLLAFRAARATGRVVGLSGEFVEGADVRLRSRKEPGLVIDTRTDPQGYFILEGLYPGSYTAEVGLSQAKEVLHRTLPAPRSLEVVIDEGEEAVLPNLVLRAGDKVVEGLLLDQDGASLEDILVIAQRIVPTDEFDRAVGGPIASARTDMDGRYELLDLPAERVLVRFAPDASLDLDWPERRLATPVDPVEVDLSKEAVRYTLPPVAARETRPFRYAARISLASLWAGEHGFSLDDVRVRVTVEGDAETGILPRSVLDWRPLEGRVLWTAETPYPPIVLHIACGDEERRVRLDPALQAVVEEALELP